jgi:STE24 endopeptidase
MAYQTGFKILFITIIVLFACTPFIYRATGIGQQAASLSAEISRGADGQLQSSPKAEARHRLLLPMRIQSLVLFPLLLLAFYFSGYAAATRCWLETHVKNRLLHPPSSTPRAVVRWFRLMPERWRESVSGWEIVTVLLFVAGLHLGVALIYLPFNFYRAFIVGHQFGLVTLTAYGWITDWGKSLLIDVAIAGLMWTGLFVLMRVLPRHWPIIGGALLFFFTGLYVLITPLVITPLFYSVTTMEDIEQQQSIMALAARAGVAVEEVYVIDASSKTTAVNAYFAGFGGAQRIVLYDTLLANYTPDQVEVVLAHELGHWYYNHVLLAMLGISAMAWIGLFVLQWIIQKTWWRLGLKSPTDVAGLPILLATIAIVSILVMPVENTVSRMGERQADEFALTISQKPAAFAALFEQLAQQNLSVVTAPPWEKLLFFSHPPIAERVRRAENFSVR